MAKLFLLALGMVAGVVAFAEQIKTAQVYEIKVTVKTTAAKKSKIYAAKNPFVDETGSVIYRKQASQTWKGLVWGCDCESALGEWKTLEANNQVVVGAVLWDTKSPYDIILLDNMNWHVLNAIDTTGAKCECAWTIGESTDMSAAFLSFAGFGTLKLNTVKEDGNLMLDENCGSYITSMSGQVSGWMPAPRLERTGRAAVCTFCGVVDPGEESSIETAEAWNYCTCLDVGDRDFTAVAGSWTLKYNAKYSKKLSEASSIIEVYSAFPASVKTEVIRKINEIKGESSEE